MKESIITDKIKIAHMVKIAFRIFFLLILVPLLFVTLVSCSGSKPGDKASALLRTLESVIEPDAQDEFRVLNTMLLLPAHPAPGEEFRIVATGGRNIRNAKIIVTCSDQTFESLKSKTGQELPCWRIDNFAGSESGWYKAILLVDKKEVARMDFEISPRGMSMPKSGVWKTTRSWDTATETLYSVWINALFQGSNEQSSWSALNEVTQNGENNFLYNYLSLDEDHAESKTKVLMEPDCADNPFFLRAYFSWKLGLPFGYHISDRGWVGHAPQTGQWITNESSSSKSNPILAFNSFIRSIMNGVHSGTARTALDNENSDYYPVELTREGLRPGTVYADPYGHTLILVSWIPQSKDHPGVLLAADAQPDKTIAIKRFWKGNFLFNTSEVVGEPGFKAFRPIVQNSGKLTLMKNDNLDSLSGFAPFSMQQRKMDGETFYHTLDRLINLKPLDPEDALMNLIKALHEQLLVRVKSVSTGEEYMKSHPGTIISMPSGANGIFQAGGDWENYSTPNRDLRLLIAMDAVLGFPDRVTKYPGDFNLSKTGSVEGIKERLQKLLDDEVSTLTISYTRTDGSEQKLTIKQLLDRREALEMAYNPNDGVEIRWGAAEGSEERSTCKRHAPSNQQATMQKVRKWFNQRLHPPT